jgi:hypothetical protein
MTVTKLKTESNSLTKLQKLVCGFFHLCWLFGIFLVNTTSAEIVGERPYEMVWAGRTNDTRLPLIDFENLEGWRVETKDAFATFTRSREQQIWGNYVGKLIYRSAGKEPVVTLRPPKPIPVPAPFDCVNLWLYGNNWAWEPDPTTPQVNVNVLFRDSEGRVTRVPLGHVNWKEWFLMHRRLPSETTGSFEGIEFTNCRNTEDRALYLDNLAVYKEELKPLTFQPRPKPPFPTREETILPDNLTSRFSVSLTQSGAGYLFRYNGDDGELEYRYEPRTGTLSDITACWIGRGKPFQPLYGGGVVPTNTPKLLEIRQVGNTVVANWQHVTYTLRLWQKSLVVDISAPGGTVSEVRFGKAIGLENPRLVTLPYLSYGGQRPAVVVAGPPDKPLFIFALPDYYRSQASSLWAINDIAPDGVTYNGGTRYLPKTDGKRNDCFERFFLTISPRFEEVLPNIPNPKSPWMHVAGERLWRAHGASNRERDYEYWKNVARYGMTNVVITDHETGWRDGGESFTFRTRAAPKKGGDEAQRDYSAKLHALGFRYGIYNNYTDFAPVNEFWDEDMVTRLPDGNWQNAWARCYNPKPLRAVEYEAKLAPIIQQKFHLSTAYCDVHTAVTPWHYVDYDARVPGAGKFTTTFYAYGEILLHQKQTWNGPVYSEGNHHWFYAGLADGNYGQDQAARLAVNPWLVDFDLRKIHPLCCNFGMGNLEMFYGNHNFYKERSDWLDRFLAATLAFGHTGFLVMEGGIENAVRSYYALQQIHAAYAQSTVAEIRYADEHGQLLDTSAAVATGAFRRSQIVIRYENGTLVIVNGHPTEIWKTAEAELPPNGWFAKSIDGKLVAFSAIVDGHRADYVDSPAYIYADGRGTFTRFPKAASDGQLIALRRADGTLEVIPVGKCSSFGVALDGRTAKAIALDKDRRELGEAETRFSRGLVYVMPHAGAFSYILIPGEKVSALPQYPREKVVPGEYVPIDAQPGSRVWKQIDGAWVDFTVVPFVYTKLSVDEQSNDKLKLELTSNAATSLVAQVTLDNNTQTATLEPSKPVFLTFPLGQRDSRTLLLQVTSGKLSFTQRWQLKTELKHLPVASLSEQFIAGQCLRGQTEESLNSQTGAIAHQEANLTCGGISKPGIFMHPPYKTGVGYAFAKFEPITLPSKLAAFRCDIGKRDGSDRGDGILFRVVVIEQNGKETVVAEKQWAEHDWTSLEADLSRWAGKTIRIKLISDVGASNNSVGDWACWSNLRIETKEPVLQTNVYRQP